MDSSVPIVEVENVVVRYGSFEALRGVSLQIPAGATGLVGRNGAGKSTLLRLLLGLVRASSGAGRVFDVPLDARGHRLRYAVGYMPENDSLVPGLRGIEQVALAGELCGLSRRTAIRRAHELLAQADLGEARYRPVEQYSTGMKQRLKLAVALAHDPKLLLLDEPTVGLDPPARQRMLEMLINLTTTHEKSLLISTHLLDDIQKTCPSIVMLEQGRVVASGPLSRVLSNGRQRYDLEWEGTSEAFFQTLKAEGLVDGSKTPSEGVLRKCRCLLSLPENYDVRRIFLLAQQDGVRIRTFVPKPEDLGSLYHRLAGRAH